MGYIPVAFNGKLNQGITSAKNGLGDMGVQGFYKLFAGDMGIGAKRLVQSLWLGAGVKVPTGKYEARRQNKCSGNVLIFFNWVPEAQMLHSMPCTTSGLQDAGINMATAIKVNTGNKETLPVWKQVRVQMPRHIIQLRIMQYVTIA